MPQGRSVLSRDAKPKPISFRVTDLLYIDDLKILVVKLNWVVNMVKTTMEDVGLEWNPKTCAVVHVRRGVHVSHKPGMILYEMARIELTLTLKMTTAQVVETSVTVNNNSPIQHFNVHPDDHTQPTYDLPLY